MQVNGALLERDEELAAVERVIRDAVGGDAALLTIEGEAGAGKTALLDAAAQLAEGVEGMRVLRARGSEFERDFAHGVVRQLFEPLLADPSVREEMLSGAAAAAAPVFDPGSALAQGGDPFSIQHGLSQLVATLADSAPLLVLVDDTQWADLASLRALAYVARRSGGLGAGLVLAVRTGEPGEHEPLLDELRRQPAAVTIEPTPLSTAAVATLIAADPERPSGDDLAAAARDATGGNPFLLGELLQALAGDHAQLADGPVNADRLASIAGAGAARAILTRLRRLGPEAVAVARAVAVLEPNAAGQWISALSGLSAEVVADACERLVVDRLLSDVQPVAFAHPLVRAAVLSEIPGPRRAADHGRAARLLSEDGAAADAVAAHLLLAEPAADPWVVAELRATAAEALVRGAPLAAISYLRRALREPPAKGDRSAVSAELGVALLRADDPEGIEVLRAVRSALDDPLERATIAAELSVPLALRRPGPEGVTLVQESLREIGDDDVAIRRLLLGHLAFHTIAGLEEVPPELESELEDWPDGRTHEGRFMFRHLSYLYAIGYGRIDDALELAARIDTDLEVYADDVRAGFPAHYGFGALTLCNRGDQIAAPIAVGMEVAKERGTITGVIVAHGVRALCGYLDGDLRTAQADVEMALRFSRANQFPLTLGAWVSAAIKIAVARGDIDAAQRVLDRVWQARAPGRGFPGAFLLVGRGELRAARGRHAEARHDFLAAAERVGWLPFANPEAIGWRPGLALSEAALGNRKEAQRLAAEAVRLAREAGGRRGIGLTLRVQGVVVGGGDGIELLREATELLAGTRARLQHAIALVELGAALRRDNQRRDAREPLRRGLDLAHRCGAAALEERARTELKATGARPRNPVLSGVESLTPSELRAARLAASGMTNREIAHDLFVTPKTVETHLRHAYQKLEIAGRTELEAALAQEHPAD